MTTEIFGMRLKSFVRTNSFSEIVLMISRSHHVNMRTLPAPLVLKAHLGLLVLPDPLALPDRGVNEGHPASMEWRALLVLLGLPAHAELMAIPVLSDQKATQVLPDPRVGLVLLVRLGQRVRLENVVLRVSVERSDLKALPVLVWTMSGLSRWMG